LNSEEKVLAMKKEHKALEAADIAKRIRTELMAWKHHVEISEQIKNIKLPNDHSMQEDYWILIDRHLLTTLLISLFKIMELYEKYQSKIIPERSRSRLKEIYKELDSLGVRDFRNQYCGHIQDYKTKKALTEEQINAHFEKFLEGRRMHEISQWIWDKEQDNATPNGCISGRLEFIANEIIGEVHSQQKQIS